MFMKTFEEKWTAWLDGELTGSELIEFEASLPDKAAAEAEKRDAKKLGAFLKQQLHARSMANEEFFSHQLRTRIESETAEPEGRREPELRTSWWTIRRLLWSGAASLAVFVVCTFFVVREQPAQDQSHYLSQVLNARVDAAANPNATISIFEAKDDRVTVLWVEGLQTLPSEYAAQ
jgi:anti-sigma factor RsiW